MSDSIADYAAALSVIRRLRAGWWWSEIEDGEGVWWKASRDLDFDNDEEPMTASEVAIVAQLDGPGRLK